MPIKLYQIKNLRAARVLVGLKGHRPSAWNKAVGKCMKDSKVTPAAVGGEVGGRYSAKFQKQFVTCAKGAKKKDGSDTKIKDATLKKWGL